MKVMSERAQDDRPNPEQLLAHTELKAMIESNVGQLSSPLLAAFILCGVEECRHERSRETTGYHGVGNESADALRPKQVGGILRTPPQAADVKEPVSVVRIALDSSGSLIF
jgi:hypothetical protein